jgi:hypothetical protein
MWTTLWNNATSDPLSVIQRSAIERLQRGSDA